MLSFINIAKAQINGPIVKCGGAGQPVCDSTAFWALIHSLINWAIYLSTFAVGLAIIYAGAMYMLSFGSEERLGKGKAAVTAAVVGLVIVLTAYLVVNTIISTLTGCSGWSIIGEFKCS